MQVLTNGNDDVVQVLAAYDAGAPFLYQSAGTLFRYQFVASLFMFASVSYRRAFRAGISKMCHNSKDKKLFPMFGS